MAPQGIFDATGRLSVDWVLDPSPSAASFASNACSSKLRTRGTVMEAAREAFKKLRRASLLVK